jgi:hypothetical protein
MKAPLLLAAPARGGCCVAALLAAALLLATPALAGPPYVTDDPQPVDYRHWEIYLASMPSRDGGAWSGTAPHVEVNYGAAPNLQLHVIMPMAFARSTNGTTTYGYGDTEFGAKYRFIQETDTRPMVGTFPLLEVPTGDQQRGLGSGQVTLYLPLWVQKSYGAWTTYGGGGYWINPGPGNYDWGFLGWLVQRQVLDEVSAGVEVFHTTTAERGAEPETRFNVGFVVDLSEVHHLLVSAGRGLQGDNEFQGYLAYQVTVGP